MENNIIRIAITQGDINGVGYETILKAFAEPEMLDICTPIIYGSKKAAIFHAKTFGSQCQFNFIDKAEDAADGKMNFLKCSDEFSRVDFGTSTETATAAANDALTRATGDLHSKLFDAMVCAPMDRTASSAYELYIDGDTRTLFMDKTCAEATDSEVVAGRIRLLHKSLRRDFRITNPRIAVITDKGDSRKDTVAAALQLVFNEGIQAFGPYDAETFTTANDCSVFDGVLSISSKKPGLNNIVLPIGTAEVCTFVNTTAQYDIAGKGLADESMMRNAIYLAIDTCRFRKEFDLPTANPLQKLYKERPDSGEKMRFSIPKKKEE